MSLEVAAYKICQRKGGCHLKLLDDGASHDCHVVFIV